ncbi:MAG: DUF1573 domain-containing protein [Chitinivibrionales bacterium]
MGIENKAYKLGIVLALVYVCPFAGPKITIDKKKVDKGIINEAEAKTVNHTFKITNTGNEVLRIDKVRPGCGCTVADYDSEIAPGETGQLSQKTSVSQLHGSSFKKSINIYSNADNEKQTRVTVYGKIQRPINLSTNYIRMKPDKDSSATYLLQLSTTKEDLKVEEVKFIPRKRKKKGDWNVEKTQFSDFKLTKTGEKNKLGANKYNLSMEFYTDNSTRKFGEIVIATNHPDKKELKINGMIDVRK